MGQPLNVRLPAALLAALDAWAAKHSISRSQAARWAVYRAVMENEPYYPPTLPNWQAEAWTSLLRGIFGNDHLILTDDTRTLLRQAVAALDNRQARVLRLRFGLDGPRHTGAEVAAIMGWADRQRVHQVEVRALSRVQGWCRARGIWKMIEEQLEGGR